MPRSNTMAQMQSRLSHFIACLWVERLCALQAHAGAVEARRFELQLHDFVCSWHALLPPSDNRPHGLHHAALLQPPQCCSCVPSACDLQHLLRAELR